MSNSITFSTPVPFGNNVKPTIGKSTTTLTAVGAQTQGSASGDVFSNMTAAGPATFSTPVAFSGDIKPTIGGSSTTLTAAEGQTKSAEDKFRDYAKMSPADKLRASMLSGMGLTEDQLKAMPADKRQEIEQRISKQIKEAAQKHMEHGGSGQGFYTDIKA